MTYPTNGWKNKGGTGGRNVPSGSWKQYWLDHSNGKPWPYYCCVEGCINRATDGAHMYCPSADRREWIVPTCHFHNMQKDEELTLRENTPLVSANVSNF